MDIIHTPQMKDMILFMAERIIESKPLLTEVDSRIGDGDHGIGMAVGFTAVKEKLAGEEYSDINQLFRQTGMAMLGSMGGASGVIFSSVFLGAVKGMEVKECVDTKEFAQMMRKGLDTVKQRGGAQPGDKTMVDALEPACDAMDSCGGTSFGELFQRAFDAAKKGVEATKNYPAKFGRAKCLMERAIGFQDAGATSVMLMFGAFLEWVKKEKANE